MQTIIKMASFILVALLLITIHPPSTALAGEAAARMEWQYRDNAYGSHPTDLQLLPNGNVLMALNGFNAPGVREVNRAGDIVWRYDGVQAASARRLPNGNTLIAVSGAPGYPHVSQILEVYPAAENKPPRTVLRYQLPDRTQAPTCAIPLENGEILITLRDRALIVNNKGTARTLIAGEKLTLTPPGQYLMNNSGNSAAANPLQLWHLVNARQTPGGNILLVDKGIRGRIPGQVLELTTQGRVVRKYNNPDQPLTRPVDALRLPGGDTLILDLGNYAVYRFDLAGELVERLTYRPVISQLPVLNQWRGWLQPGGWFLLSLLYTNNQSLAVELNDKIPVVQINGQPLLQRGAPQTPFLEEGRLLVPLRPVLEGVGGTLHLDEGTGNWVLNCRNRRVTLQTGSTAYFVDGTSQNLPLAPRLVEGSLYIPLTLLRDAFGFTVNWDGSTRMAEILF